ncbi:uncharacterized protein LOC143208975 isoform X2 [Lasioglossum baleicum]|uniref:uncharacterized protein LOC143208975 isoform X2 n=1 Tax=Lasioglossum baleicum TaxID=434251 RepID=UPI003FCDCF04
MANTSALPRNSAGPRSSNNFDGIIERIDNLRLSCEIGQKIGSADRGESTRSDRQKKWNITLDNENDNDRSDRNEDDNGNENGKQEDADRTDRLIARGPMKSQVVLRSRDNPYDWAYNVQQIQQPARTNETYLLDYEQTACLDQLQANVRSLFYHLNEIENEECSGIQDASAQFGFDLACDGDDDTALLEKVLRGDLQSAQYCPSIDNPATTTTAAASRHDSPVISSSECQHPNYVSCAECPWMQKKSNHLQSPLGSPVTAAATTCHRTPQLSLDEQNTYSLSPCSSISPYSSPSIQSYGEAYSPNGSNYRPSSRMVNGILGSSIEEVLGDELDNFSFWNDSFKPLEENCNIPDSVKSLDDAPNCDTIDNNELQLVEEVLRIRPQKIADVSRNANPDPIHIQVPNPYQTNSDAPSTSEYRIPHNDDSIARTDYQIDVAVPNYATEENKSVHSDATNGYHNGSTEPEFPSIPQSFVTNPVRPVANGVNNMKNVNDMNNLNSVSGIAAQLLFSERQRRQSVGEFQTPKFTNNRDDLQIPKTVACFESSARPSMRRNIIPWPLLKLPLVKASERLKDAVDPKEVERAMRCLLKWSPEEIAKRDEDGYTTLMCLVGNPEEIGKKLAYLAPLVERTPRDVLSYTNNRDEDALYLAALNCPQYAFVAGYLAATMLDKGIDVSQKLYNTRGNTLIHLVAGQGDSHAEIMADLLVLRTKQGNRVFDLSKRNYDGKTALHVAIESHEPLTKGVSSVATVKLLLECGADPRVPERKSGDSALHMAVSLTTDPALVKCRGAFGS